MSRIIVICLMGLVQIACSGSSKDGSTNKKTVHGVASVVLGASDVTGKQDLRHEANHPKLVPGNWRLSPNKAKITFTRIDFVASNSNSTSANLSNCTVTYDRSQASGTNLLDCPFDLQLTSQDGGATYAGSYIGIYIYYERTVQVLLDGGGIYSDNSSLTKLSDAEPAEGAEYVDYTIGGGTGPVTSQIYFSTPFQVSDTETPSIKIVTDMIHTILGEVVGTTPQFQPNSGQTPVELMAIPGSADGRAEFYTTAASIESSYQEGTDGDEYFYARIFYADNNPVSVITSGYLPLCLEGSGPGQAWAVNPATAPLQDSQGNKAGGFLGLSLTNDISWAFATSWQWTAYRALFVLPQVTTIGNSATMDCQTTSSVPLPSNGGQTYASGTPAITPTLSIDLKLLAK